LARDGKSPGAALGLFGIGLGVAELVAPAEVARWVGARDTAQSRAIVRAFGVREIASGVGLLARPHAASRVWARVVGDVLDLALLGAVFASRSTRRNRTLASLLAIAGVTAVDAVVAKRLTHTRAPKLRSPVHVVKAITINRPPSELYAFWRNLENLPRFMAHLESVRTDGDRSTWQARSIAGSTIEWQAEITQDCLDESIAWRSLPNSTISNRGIVRFVQAPGGRGTQLTVELKYDVPGGKYAAAIAKLFGAEPGQEIESDLRRLKQILETGEVMRSDASIHRGMHPACPSEKPFTLGKAARQ
jgi:uncharacterized membrane protein